LGRILVEVITPMVGDLRQCTTCQALMGQTGVGQSVHDELLAEYPQWLRQDSQRLLDWLLDLTDRFGEALSIKVIDSQSFSGFCKSLRHWARTYPAFIVCGRRRLVGWDRDELDRILLDCLGAG